MKTKYFGIYKEHDEDGWWLWAETDGDMVYFDSEPTDTQIMDFREDILAARGY